MDLISGIAKDQGFTVDIKPLGFDAALQAVQAKQVAGVIAGMSITEDRKKVFDFSDPYFESGVQMAVLATNNDVKSYDDLHGKRVAVKNGTEGAEFADSIRAKYGFDVVSFADSSSMFDEIRTGNSQAVFEDYPVLSLKWSMSQNKMPTCTPKAGGCSNADSRRAIASPRFASPVRVSNRQQFELLLHLHPIIDDAQRRDGPSVWPSASTYGMGLYYSGGYDWPYNDALLKNPADSFLAMPHTPDYVRYATAHVRDLIERYRPSILWNDIGWPAGGDLAALFADYYNAVPDGVSTTVGRAAGHRGAVTDALARAGGTLVQRLWPLIPDDRKSLTFSATHHYDIRTPEYASFDSIQDKKWESTRGVGHSFGANRNGAPRTS